MEALTPGPEMGELPKRFAAAAEEWGIDQLPADQGWKQAHIGQGEVFATEPGVLILEAAFHLFECFKQLCFRFPIGVLVAGETAAVNAVIHR